MLAIFFEADSKGLYQSSAKKKGKLLSCVPVLDKSWNWAFSRPSRGVTAKKWTEKRDARAKLLFCQSKPSVFCRSRWPRRSRCFSSLMIDRNPSACSCAWILRLCWHYPVKWEQQRPGEAQVVNTHRTLCRSGRLTERVWCTKIQSSLLNIYFRLSGFQSSPLVIDFRYGPNRHSHCTKVWHQTYPICDAPLLRSTFDKLNETEQD